MAFVLLPGCSRDDTGEESFTFIFMSDTQADPEIGDYTVFGELLELALDHTSQPNLLVLGGDNVNSGNQSAEWEAFWGAAGNKLDDIFVASVAGNHDNNPLLAEQFDLPQTAPENNTEGFFYTFLKGNIFFLMLDSNIMGAGNESDVQWLRDQLSSYYATGADWRVAILHHPFWTVADVPRDVQRAEVMRANFLPVMEANGVDLILCGHQHVYSRTVPLRNGIVAENGIIQIMTASGAKDSYSPADKEYIARTAETPVYLIIEAGIKTLIVTAYDSAGEQFDNVQITKR